MDKDIWLFIGGFLAVILAVGLVIGLIQWWIRHRKGVANDEPIVLPEEPEECCGQHATCEKDSLLAAVSKEIEYFEDEDLDRFRGRASEDYQTIEEEEFREILYTLKQEEVAAWVRSLQLRQIEIPIGLRDELLMIVREQRVYDI